MKHEGADFIIHRLFVDDMMHVPTCYKLRDEFLELYKKDFEITGRGLIETFLARAMDVERYTQDFLTEYKDYIKRALRPKRVPMSPGIILTNEDGPITPDQRKQKYYKSFIAIDSPSFNSLQLHLGFALTFHSRNQRLLVSVHQWVHGTGLHCII
jgi:hypothetical protein